jgi:hypothetical protein
MRSEARKAAKHVSRVVGLGFQGQREGRGRTGKSETARKWWRRRERTGTRAATELKKSAFHSVDAAEMRHRGSRTCSARENRRAESAENERTNGEEEKESSGDEESGGQGAGWSGSREGGG